MNHDTIQWAERHLGVPVIVGAGGIERVVELELSAEARAMLEKSAASVRKVVDVVKASAQ